MKAKGPREEFDDLRASISRLGDRAQRFQIVGTGARRDTNPYRIADELTVWAKGLEDLAQEARRLSAESRDRTASILITSRRRRMERAVWEFASARKSREPAGEEEAV